MATSLQSENTIDFNGAKLNLAHNKQFKENVDDQYYDLRIRLTNLLQTTLDLERILQLFLNEIQTVIEIGGISYRHDAQEILIKIGKQATHSCGYRLITPKDMLGELTFTRSKRFSERQLETVELLLSNLLCPLRNALLYQEAIQTALKDPLTGAGNRIAMDNSLRREVELAKRHNQSLSLLIVDLDHFKEINDKHGHTAGDALLKTSVKCFQKTLRKTDLLFRFGGEEFVILLNKTAQTGASIIAERIRQEVADSSCTYQDQTLQVTISIGIATLTGTDTLDSLFDRADKALYQAKNNGRNQVCGKTS